jgi:hypothetical protein
MVVNDRLLIALRDLPVDWPEVPEVTVGAERVARRPSVALRVAGAVAGTLIAVVGLVTPVREAVADWLGIGVVRVEIIESLPDGLATTLDLGRQVDSVDLVGPEDLPEPSAAFVRDGETSLVWVPSSDLPEVAGAGVGAILTRFDGAFDPAVEKSLGTASTLQVVSVDGAHAYWIEGEPHSFVYLDAEGRPIESSARLAGNTLIWERDGATWRFESGLDLAGALGLFEG